MTCVIQYSVHNDYIELVLFGANQFDGSRTFFGGKEPITVPRGERPPDQCIHQVSTVWMIELMDAMLAYGIRPSSNAWSSPHIADLKAHISFAERMATSLLPKQEQPHG